MPELPDLHVIAQNLDKIYSNKCLLNISLADKAKINADPKEYNKLLVGKKVSNISRFGKEIKILFENDHTLFLHLMREGKFFKTDEDVKNIILKLEFEEDRILVMSDFMGQAKVSLDAEVPDVPDPFSEQFTEKYLKQRLVGKKRTAIKMFLINQDNILGIGNAYADEILWETRLSPATKCGDIPDSIVEALYKNIIAVLETAVNKIKEIEPNIISGEIRSFMNVHNKDKKLSPTGYEILTDKVGGKITYFTEEQVLYK